jgi:hypothetical protein
VFELPFSTEHGGGSWNEIFVHRHESSFDLLFTTRGTAAVEGGCLVAIFRIDTPLTPSSGLVAARVTIQELIELSGLSALQILTSSVFQRIGFLGFLPQEDVPLYWELREYAALPSFKRNVLTLTPNVAFFAGSINPSFAIY